MSDFSVRRNTEPDRDDVYMYASGHWHCVLLGTRTGQLARVLRTRVLTVIVDMYRHLSLKCEAIEATLDSNSLSPHSSVIYSNHD